MLPSLRSTLPRRPLRRGSFLLCLVLVLVAGLAVGLAPASADPPEEPPVDQPVYPLGTLTRLTAGDSQCDVLPGWACESFRVSNCSGVAAEKKGWLAVSPEPAGGAHGVVMMMAGGGGTRYWSYGNTEGATTVDALYQQDGLRVVQVRWQDGWSRASSGEQAGTARLACRIATVAKYLHDTYWDSPTDPNDGVAPAIGQCGFCMVGASGSSGGIAYALSHYGLDAEVDAIVPHGGPTHVAIERGCGVYREDVNYLYQSPDEFDRAWGWTDSTGQWSYLNGPCRLHDASFLPTFASQSVNAVGADNVYPTTRVHVVDGEFDLRQRERAQREYANWLVEGGSALLNIQVVPNMEHNLNHDGYVAVRGALTWTGGTGCANGLDDDWDGQADFPADPGCTSAADPWEREPSSPTPGSSACDNGLDEDGDGLADWSRTTATKNVSSKDPGCSSPADDTETGSLTCDNAIDDDGDGTSDFPADPGCNGPGDDKPSAPGAELNAAVQCDDGVDQDGDGKIDYNADASGDPDCTGPADTTEGTAPPTSPALSLAGATITERDPEDTKPRCGFKVTLSPAANTSVSFFYATANGTAVAPGDYTSKSGTLSMAAGVTTKTIYVQAINDNVKESDETLTLTISSPQGATIAEGKGTATCTIRNDD